jgi:hypothetical protein
MCSGDSLPVRWREGWGEGFGRIRKTLQLPRAEDAILDAASPGMGFLGVIGAAIAHHPDVWAQVGDLGKRVRLQGAADQFHAADVPNCAQEVESFSLGELRRLTGEFLDRVIRPEQHGQLAELRGLLEETEVRRPKVIERARDDDLFGHGGQSLTRT